MRVIKITLWSVCCSAIFFSACKKDEPVNQPGTPVFHANGLMNGQPFSIEAGVNNYYMYSSCPSDANGVYEYTGTFRSQSCNANCPNTLTIRIRDYAQHSFFSTDPAVALAPGNYNFADSSTSNFLVSFMSQLQPGDSLVSINWSFGSNVVNPSHPYAFGGTYPVTMNATVQHNSMIRNCSAFDSVHVVPPAPCMNVDFTATDVDMDTLFFGDSLLFNATVSGGTAPYNYVWDFGDSQTDSGNAIIHSYGALLSYPVELYVIDALGCRQWKRMNVVAPHSDSTVVNFTYQQNSVLNFSQVTMEWTDASGTIYSTDGGTQPGTSSFQIISEEEYQVNENQEPTKKVHALVTCTLFNGSNTILLQNVDLIFAVAYH